MKLRHNQTGHIYNSEWEFRQAHSNVSFPHPLDQNAFDFADVSVVRETPAPLCSVYERVNYDGVQLVDGQWQDTWSIHPKFDDSTEQAAWEAEVLESQWYSVRVERDRLLAATDYTDLPNTPITEECRNEFVTYRQTLRNITHQADPFNIIWPTIPTYIKV